MDKIQGTIIVEDLAPDDIFSAADTTAGRRASLGGVCLPWAGQMSPEELIAWAMGDISAAMSPNTSPADKSRNATNAVMNARRALDCLVETYLNGFGFLQCKGAPTNSWEKSARLLERGVVDDLTQHVLARAIDVRNNIEHNFDSAELEQAQDIVELLRRVCGHLPTQRDPVIGTCFINLESSHGISAGKNGPSATFSGWSEPFKAGIVIAAFVRCPWMGVVIPQSASTALLRRAWLKDVPIEVLGKVWDRFGKTRASGAIGTAYWSLLFKEMGFPEELR